MAAALTYRDFRVLWIGAFLSTIGTWMQKVAQNWLVLTISGTSSAFFLGLDSFLGELPILLFTLIGGVVADRHDRRRLLLTSQYIQMATAFTLAGLVYFDVVRIWHVLTLSVIAGLGQAFGGPAYQSMLPSLVEKRDVPNAIAFNSIQFNLARVLGPLLAGSALAVVGMVACFALNGVSFLTVIAAILMLHLRHLPVTTTTRLHEEMATGLRYVRADRALVSLSCLGFAAAFFGDPLLTFLPQFTKDVFAGDVNQYTRLMACAGAGAVCGALGVAWLGRFSHMGRALLIVQVVFGLLIALFAMSHQLWMNAVLLFGAGACMVMVFSTLSSLVQLTAPNEMRGRVMSIYMVAFRGGSPLGSLVSGWLATLTSAPTVLIVNGILLSGVAAWVLFKGTVSESCSEQARQVVQTVHRARCRSGVAVFSTVVFTLAVFAAGSVGAQSNSTPPSDPTAQPSPTAPIDPAAPATLDTPAPHGGFFTTIRNWTHDIKLGRRINGEVDGWYPRLGSVTRGSGFAAGPGYRGPIASHGPFIDVSGALSIKGYKAVDARARWLQALDNRLQIWSDFRYEDFPEQDYFGTGMDSTPDTRTSYAFDSLELQARAVFRPRRWLRLTATTGYQWPEIGIGTDSRYPSIEQLFTDGQAPGLLEQPTFLRTTVSADLDSRDTPGNTTSGGLLRVSYGLWNDVSLDRFNFHRVDAHLVHFVPLTAGRQHIVSGRIGTSYVNNAAGSRVPFYYLAYAGGMDTIRSFPEFRFQDENAAWLSAEYKWRPVRQLSVAVFADAGEVREDWLRLARHGIKTGYGAGVGLHTARQTIVRVDFGNGGGEGWQMFIKVRPTF